MLEAYIAENRDKNDKFYSLREDLNTLVYLEENYYDVDSLLLLPYINDPELLLYAFYSIDLREQKEFVSIKDSDIIPIGQDTYIKVLKNTNKTKWITTLLQKINSITIKGKEIWRLETKLLGKHNVSNHYVYIVIDTETPANNKVYFIEAIDNDLWIPTKYSQIS